MNVGAQQDRRPMELAISDLEDLSQRIRSLGLDAYSDAETGRCLDVCLHLTACVLEKIRALAGQQDVPGRMRPTGDTGGRPTVVERARIMVGARGHLALPERFLTSLDIKAGDAVIVVREEKQLTILSQAAEVDRVRRLIARHMPADVTSASQFLAEYGRRSPDGGECD